MEKCIKDEDMKVLVKFLRSKGHNITFDENPSPEKVARMTTMVKMMRSRNE